MNQDNHTTTGDRFCFCELNPDCLTVVFVPICVSCYNCTSFICCFCCVAEMEMGPLLLLLIMWQVVESLAIDCCCCCCCCCGCCGWLLGQLALLLLLLTPTVIVCVLRFTNKHGWCRRCSWCTTSSRSSKSTPDHTTESCDWQHFNSIQCSVLAMWNGTEYWHLKKMIFLNMKCKVCRYKTTHFLCYIAWDTDTNQQTINKIK